MVYFRRSNLTFFLLPTFAVGIDADDGRPFFEIAWLCWGIGIGEAP